MTYHWNSTADINSTVGNSVSPLIPLLVIVACVFVILGCLAYSVETFSWIEYMFNRISRFVGLAVKGCIPAVFGVSLYYVYKVMKRFSVSGETILTYGGIGLSVFAGLVILGYYTEKFFERVIWVQAEYKDGDRSD